MTRDPAVREIRLFLLLTLLLSSPFYTYLFLAAAPRWTDLHSAAFMWTPGLAALGTRWITSRSLRGLGWQRAGWRHLLGSVAWPWLLIGLVYAVVWATGLGAFDGAKWVAITQGSGFGFVLAVGLALALTFRRMRAAVER